MFVFLIFNQFAVQCEEKLVKRGSNIPGAILWLGTQNVVLIYCAKNK